MVMLYVLNCPFIIQTCYSEVHKMCRQLSTLCTVDFSLFYLIPMLAAMLQSCCELEQSSSSDWNKKNSQLPKVSTLVYLFLAQLLIIRGGIVLGRMLLCLPHQTSLLIGLPPATQSPALGLSSSSVVWTVYTARVQVS